MKSRITIDVDYDNQPIIKIEYQESEDVRDKLVKRFMETFGGKSCYATFYFTSLGMVVNSHAMLRPIPSDELVRHAEDMQRLALDKDPETTLKNE